MINTLWFGLTRARKTILHIGYVKIVPGGVPFMNEADRLRKQYFLGQITNSTYFWASCNLVKVNSAKLQNILKWNLFWTLFSIFPRNCQKAEVLADYLISFKKPDIRIIKNIKMTRKLFERSQFEDLSKTNMERIIVPNELREMK